MNTALGASRGGIGDSRPFPFVSAAVYGAEGGVSSRPWLGSGNPGVQSVPAPTAVGMGTCHPSGHGLRAAAAGVCVPGGGNSAGGGRAVKKKHFEVVLAVLGQHRRPLGRAQAKPGEAAFPLLFQREVVHARPHRPPANAVGLLAKRHRRAGSPLLAPAAPAWQGAPSSLR